MILPNYLMITIATTRSSHILVISFCIINHPWIVISIHFSKNSSTTVAWYIHSYYSYEWLISDHEKCVEADLRLWDCHGRLILWVCNSSSTCSIIIYISSATILAFSLAKCA